MSQTEAFENWKKLRVSIDPSILAGEPVFSNSRLSVSHIGTLAKRITTSEIREDYPYLTEDDILFAAQYTPK